MTSPQTQINHSRRTFLKASISGTGLALTAIHLPVNGAANSPTQQSPQELRFPLLVIHFDNNITLFNTRSEMGQGVTTTLAQYMLEELDADWSQIKEVQQAGADAKRFGHQNTIGAISSFIGWKFHREAGAKIRQLLVNQALAVWKADADAVKTDKGFVWHKQTKQKISYGELASLIKNTDLPEAFELKKAEQFKLIGTSAKRLDLPDKITGQARFGIDTHLPGIKTAVVLRSPVFGGQLGSANSEELQNEPGILRVFTIPQGLAIVAKTYWHASQARKKAQLKWQHSDFEKQSSDSLLAEFRQQLNSPQKQLNTRGEPVSRIKTANSSWQLDFEFPLIAHATMEPMNCTAWYDNDKLKIWAPTQNRNDAKAALVETFALKEEQIEFNTTLMGGGFGRRAQEDFVLEAAAIAKQVPWPVKVIWSREDDIQHDFYRPLNAQRIQASLNEKKQLNAWQHNVAALSTSPYHFSLEERNTESGDWVAYGGAEESLYESEHFSCGISLNKTPMTTGIMRGISHGYVNFTRELMMSHLAEQTQQDPIAFRQQHIDHPRANKVLTTLANLCKSWPTKDHAVGHAFGFEKAPQGPYQYYNAAAFVMKKQQGKWQPEKLVLVLDHGTIINPDGLLSQLEGATIFALGMLLQNRIELKNGAIQQSNFHDYQVPRMGSQLPIELHTIDSTEWPMGVGEKLQGTIQPAIANAIGQITKQVITQIPISRGLLQQHNIQLGES